MTTLLLKTFLLEEGRDFFLCYDLHVLFYELHGTLKPSLEILMRKILLLKSKWLVHLHF